MKGGHVAGAVSLVGYPRLYQKVLLLGQNFVPAACRMKFSWYKFVRHEAEQSDPHH